MKNIDSYKRKDLILITLSVLLLFALSTIGIIYFYTYNDNENWIVKFLYSFFVILTGYDLYFILRRTKVNKYIYMSYSIKDKNTVDSFSALLNLKLNKNSKYRYLFKSNDSIPFGEDINKSAENYINKADIIIVFVSEKYIDNPYCQKELIYSYENNKKIIPVVIDSFDNLKKISPDISTLKSMSLIDCNDIEMQEKAVVLSDNIKSTISYKKKRKKEIPT